MNIGKRNHGVLTDLRKLLQAGTASTQEALCSALVAQGHQVTQSKMSRLLRKLNAIKTQNATGDTVYCLDLEPAPPTLDTSLALCILAINSNEQLIVINTSPGAAQLVARIIDHHQDRLNILGTIAGDDTIFITPKKIHDIEKTTAALKKLLSF